MENTESANTESVNTVKTRQRRTARKGSLELHHGKYRIIVMYNGQRIVQATNTADREEAERIRDEFVSQFTAKDETAQIKKISTILKGKEAMEKEAEERALDALPAMKLSEAWGFYDKATLLASGKREVTPRTFVIYRETFGHIVEWFAKRFPTCTELRHVGDKQVEAFVEYYKAKLAGSTYNRYIRVCRAIWNVLGKKARCKGNPWIGLQGAPRDGIRKLNLTEKDLQKFFKSLDPESDLYKLCLIGCYTGLRLGDAATLRWEKIDMERRVIITRPQKTQKYETEVALPIHPKLYAMFQLLPTRSGYLLPEMAQLHLMHGSLLSRKIEEAFTNAGFKTNIKIDGRKWRANQYGFHSFRHSFVSMCGKSGNIALVQSMVGHLSKDMTMHYFHGNLDASRQLVDTLPDITSGKTIMEYSLDKMKVLAADLSQKEIKEMITHLQSLLK